MAAESTREIDVAQKGAQDFFAALWKPGIGCVLRVPLDEETLSKISAESFVIVGSHGRTTKVQAIHISDWLANQLGAVQDLMIGQGDLKEEILTRSIEKIIGHLKIVFKSMNPGDKEDRESVWKSLAEDLRYAIEANYDDPLFHQRQMFLLYLNAYGRESWSEAIEANKGSFEKELQKLFLGDTRGQLAINRRRKVFQDSIAYLQTNYERTTHRVLTLPDMWQCGGAILLPLVSAGIASLVSPEHTAQTLASTGVLSGMALVGETIRRTMSRRELNPGQKAHFAKLGKEYRSRYKEKLPQFAAASLSSWGMLGLLQEQLDTRFEILQTRGESKQKARGRPVLVVPPLPAATKLKEIGFQLPPTMAPIPVPSSTTLLSGASSSTGSETSSSSLHFRGRHDRYGARLTADTFPETKETLLQLLQAALKREYPDTHQWIQIREENGILTLYDYRSEHVQEKINSKRYASIKGKLETFIRETPNRSYFQQTDEAFRGKKLYCKGGDPKLGGLRFLATEGATLHIAMHPGSAGSILKLKMFMFTDIDDPHERTIVDRRPGVFPDVQTPSLSDVRSMST